MSDIGEAQAPESSIARLQMLVFFLRGALGVIEK